MASSYLDTVLLRKLGRLGLASRRPVSSTAKGERRSLRKGSSINFVDYRPYNPGDDVTQIDWNIYGRSDNLVVKLFEDEQTITTHLLVDNSRSMDWGEPNKLQIALHVAAALGYVALNSFDRLLCTTFSDSLTGSFGPAVNQRETYALFNFLAKVKSAGETDFEAVLRRYAMQNRQPGLAIILSDLLARDGFEKGLKYLLERRYDVVLLHVLAPAEIHPAIGGDVKLVDRETGRFVDITLNQRAVNLYRDRYASWTGHIEKFCARQGVFYERIESSETLESLL
ncbi:MAG: DUF58 domain-containing protein, partial [Chloroflexota bacterium]